MKKLIAHIKCDWHCLRSLFASFKEGTSQVEDECRKFIGKTNGKTNIISCTCGKVFWERKTNNPFLQFFNEFVKEGLKNVLKKQ